MQGMKKSIDKHNLSDSKPIYYHVTLFYGYFSKQYTVTYSHKFAVSEKINKYMDIGH